MNSPEITAAKMICKSIDALTREVYMLRKDVAEKDILEKEIITGTYYLGNIIARNAKKSKKNASNG